MNIFRPCALKDHMVIVLTLSAKFSGERDQPTGLGVPERKKLRIHKILGYATLIFRKRAPRQQSMFHKRVERHLITQ